jgi:hypothetical protein
VQNLKESLVIKKKITERKLHLDKRAADIVKATRGSDDKLLTAREAARWLGVSEKWLATGRTDQYGPPYIVLENDAIRYPLGMGRAWLMTRVRTSTAEYDNKGRGRRPYKLAEA